MSTGVDVPELIRESEKVEVILEKLDRKDRSTHYNMWEGVLKKLANDFPKEKDKVESLKLIIKTNTLKSILFHMPFISYEARQNVKKIWQIIFTEKDLIPLGVEYIRQYPEILIMLVRGSASRDKTSGDMFRTVLNTQSIHYLLLNSALIWQFFEVASTEDYEVSSEAFKTLKLAIVQRSSPGEMKAVASFLTKQFEGFFHQLGKLICNDTYHVKRMALKFLSEILQRRDFFSTMVKYIGIPSNLKMVADILCNPENEKNQYLAFHVFKFFVANPRRTKQINAILTKRKKAILETLLVMKKQDEVEYGRELPLLIERISEL
ncbi:hypothetical protein AAMO2058_001023100 [Amorphochlora amoebiformis]